MPCRTRISGGDLTQNSRRGERWQDTDKCKCAWNLPFYKGLLDIKHRMTGYHIYATLRVCYAIDKTKINFMFFFRKQTQKFVNIDLNSITLFVRSFTYIFVVVAILYS